MREINQAGIDLIKRYEGKQNNAYQDQKGIWTNGYGHTRGVIQGDCITDNQAEALLKEDLAAAQIAVERLIYSSINDNQFAALVSLTFNIGPTAFANSNLLKNTNAGYLNLIPDCFMDWCHVGQEINLGLVKRRAAEGRLWITPI